MQNITLDDATLLRVLEEKAQQYTEPPEVHWRRRNVPPAASHYITRDDHLAVSVYTTSTTTGLTLCLRMIDAAGAMHYQRESLDGAPTSTLTTRIFTLAEGWLMGVSASNLGGGLADQVCFVCIALQRSPQTSTPPHTVLAQGYVTNLYTVDWPPVYVRGPAPASGGAHGFRVSAATSQLITATNMQFNFPTGSGIGDLCVLCMAAQNNMTVSPAGWTAYENGLAAVAFWGGGLFTRLLSAADVATGYVPVTFSGTGGLGIMVNFLGAGAGPRETGSQTNGTAGANTAASIALTTSSGNITDDVLLWFGSNRASGSDTFNVGTQVATISDGSANSGCVYAQTGISGIVTGTASYPGTYNPKGNYTAFMVCKAH